MRTTHSIILLTLKSGSLSRFIHVEAVGSLSGSEPAFWIQKGGSKSFKQNVKETEDKSSNIKP